MVQTQKPKKNQSSADEARKLWRDWREQPGLLKEEGEKRVHSPQINAWKPGGCKLAYQITMFSGWTHPVSLLREFHHLGWGDLPVCMYTCIGTCVHLCVQVEARGIWRHLLPSFSTLIFELGSRTGTESSPVRLGWLSNKSQRSFISVSPALRFQVCITVPVMEMELKASCSQGRQFTNWAISPALLQQLHNLLSCLLSHYWELSLRTKDRYNKLSNQKKKTDYKGLFCFVPFCDNILECSPACLQTGNPSASLPWVTGVPGCRLRGFKDSEVEAHWERILGILYCLSDPSAQKRERKSTSFLRLIHECLSYSSIYKIPNLGS